jgi:monoamine oxidase
MEAAMPRTPLLHAVRRLAEDVEIASSRGVTVEEVRAERALLRSRRDFLRGAAATTGLLLASPGRAIVRRGASPRIAIVGGGIAGLSAALRLQDASFPATVYEAAPGVGGRIHSDATSWANGQVSESCGQFIDSGHATMRSLARRFGLPLVDLIRAEPPGSTSTFSLDGRYYAERQAARDFQEVFPTMREQLQAARYPTQWNHYTATGFALDHTSLSAWIDSYVPGGHGSALGQLLDVAYLTEYGRDTAEQSSLNLLYLLGGQPTKGELSLFGESDERFWIAGGNEALPRAIADALLPDSVRTGHRLAAIEKRSDGVIRLTFDTEAGSEIVDADHVLLTLSFPALRGVDLSRADFDALKLQAIDTLGYGTNSKLHVQLDSRYWNEPGPWGVSNGETFTDLAFQGGWDMTLGQEGETGIFVDYTGGTKGASYTPSAPYIVGAEVEPYAEELLSELGSVFPGIGSRYVHRATLSCPWLDPNLGGSYSCWLVGQYTTIGGYEAVPQGNVHFAGEHCSTDFQGYMEGGAREGVRAADEILTATLR